MAGTHNIEWTIERGEDEPFVVCVDYTFKGGAPAHYGSLSYPGHPADPDEIEIEAVWRKTDESNPNAPAFQLTDEEREKIEAHIAEHPPEPDDDYDDYREDR